MAYFAEFKTGYDQREIPMLAFVDDISTSYMQVGQMVKVEQGVVKTLSASTEIEALKEATHIIAQSDMTLERGHAPIEYGDYRYSNKVAGTVETKGKVSGVYDTKLNFPAAASENSAYVAYAEDENKVYKSSGTVWTEDTSGKSFVKCVALFKIIDKDDLIVRVNG